MRWHLVGGVVVAVTGVVTVGFGVLALAGGELVTGFTQVLTGVSTVAVVNAFRLTRRAERTWRELSDWHRRRRERGCPGCGFRDLS